MTRSKKQIILEYCNQHGLRTAGTEEIRAIGDEIRRTLGGEVKISSSYISQVLEEVGIALNDGVRRFHSPAPEPYATELKGALGFKDLSSAEACLRRLDEVYRRYVQEADRKGISLVRSLLLKGKERARRLAADPRVDLAKRREKEEVVRWFTVWLQSPDLFFDWLELRKNSEEFQRAFCEPRCP